MKYRVLVVDDEEILREGLRTFVSWDDLGYEFAGSANSVAQALVFLESHDVDVMITDIKMPVQNGLQLLEIMHEEYPDTKVVVLSGYGEFEYAQKAIRFGAVDFLMKPVNFAELKRLMFCLRERMDEERKQSMAIQEYYRLRLTNLLNTLSHGDTDTAPLDSVLPPEVRGRPYCLLRIHCRFDIACPPDGKTEIEAVIQKVSPPFGQVLCYNNELREIACLFWSDKGIQTDGTDFAEASSGILERMKIPVIIGVSLCHNDLSTLHQAYVQAGKALQYHLIKNKSSVIAYSEIADLLSGQCSLECHFDREFFSGVTEPEKRNSVLPELLARMDMIYRDGENISYICAFCIQALLTVTNCLENYTGRETEFDKKLYGVIRQISLCNQMDEMKQFVSSYLTDVVDSVNAFERDDHFGNLIKNIRLYINEHYAEGLTLKILADVFYLHPIYLSHIFKEKTGTNYLDYLTEIRMEKAKEFLKNQEYKIYNISQKVGYENPCYFSKLFKNYTGMTPKKYRDSVDNKI